jgi:hypothetical protein
VIADPIQARREQLEHALTEKEIVTRAELERRDQHVGVFYLFAFAP